MTTSFVRHSVEKNLGRESRRGREDVLESGICLTETRIKNGRTPSPGISDSIGMCRECPPGDVLTPCHSVGPRVPKYPFGTFHRSREFPEPKIRGRMPDHTSLDYIRLLSRVFSRSTSGALSAKRVTQYIRHRLLIEVFPPRAMRHMCLRIYKKI